VSVPKALALTLTLGIAALRTVTAGTAGALAGYALGKAGSPHYRGVFRAGSDPGLDPSRVGLLLGRIGRLRAAPSPE
jgi:hypothetical protein